MFSRFSTFSATALCIIIFLGVFPSVFSQTFDYTTDLRVYYPFNGNANNEFGPANDGIVTGAQLTDDRCGNPNSAYLFNQDDIIQVPHQLCSDCFYGSTSDSGLTMSVWIKTTNSPDIASTISSSTSSYLGNFQGFSMLTSGIVAYNYYLWPASLQSTTAINDGNWHHIAFTSYAFGPWPAIYTNKLYVDGQLEATSDDYISFSQVGNIDIPFMIGNNEQLDNGFDGSIDDIFMYVRALTQEEVLDLYNFNGCNSFGTISGTVSSNGIGLQSILVKLLDSDGLPVSEFDDQYTGTNGEYSFVDVPVGDYQIMIVEPLGYIVDLNPKPAIVVGNETTIVDFELTEVVAMNNARSKGYWKHQFDVYVKGRGNAQESEQDLQSYIDLVHQHYTLYYDIFTNVNTFEEWQAILSLKGNHPMADRAKQHLSAVMLNMVSNKVGQYTVVAEDGRDVGDVIQYVSELIIDGDDTNDELAKDLAERVNNQQMIAAGIVPDGSIIFKQGTKPGEVLTYELFSNYPNPFNPSTTIKYQIPEAGFVTLKVYDVLGNELALLITEQKQAGRYEVNFDASNLSSGVYVYKISVNDFVSTKKMVLMK